MGLLGNYTSLNSNVGKSIGSFSNSYERLKISRMMSFYYGDSSIEDITDKSAFNNGYNSHYSWTLSPKAGGMSFSIQGNSSIIADLIPQKLLEADLGGHSYFTATSSLLIAMICSLTGNSTITASISGKGKMSSNFTGTSTLSGNIKGFANIITSLLGTSDLNIDVNAIGDMTIDITVTGAGLSLSNVGQAVWSALAANNNLPDTMGELLNSAGGGASPSIIAQAVWDELNSGHTTPDSYGKIVSDLETMIKFIKTLELNQL